MDTSSAQSDDRSTGGDRARGDGTPPTDRGAAGTTRRAVLRASAWAAGLGAGASAATSDAEAAGAGSDDETGADGAANRNDARDVMFTCNAKDGSVSLIDAHTHRNVRTISVYPDTDPEDQVSDAIDEVEPRLLNAFARENYLEHVNVSPDGRTLYASRGHAGDVVAVDVETGEKRWETELYGFRADHQTISPDGAYLFTSDLAADRVEKIDAETGEIVGGAVVRDLPHGNHYHELPAFDGEPTLINGSLGNMVYPDSQTGDGWAHRLTFLDPESTATRRTVSFEEGVRPFAISHDGRKAYVQLSYFHGFHEYDIDENRIARTKELPKTEHVPESESDYPLQSAHHGIDISGDGEYVCVAGTTSWYVAIVRRSTLELVGTIPVGEHPYWVRTGPNGEHAFVPVRAENEVAVISYADAEEVARVPVGAQPHVTEYAAVPAEIL